MEKDDIYDRQQLKIKVVGKVIIFIVLSISVISVILIITGKNEAEKRKKLFDEEAGKSAVNMIHKIKKVIFPNMYLQMALGKQTN